MPRRRSTRQSKPLHHKTKYERSLILRLRWIRAALLTLKAQVCDTDAERIEEVISLVHLQVIGPWNIDDAERRFSELYPEFSEAAPDGTQEIELACPPGDPQPDDLIDSVIEGTGLPARAPASPSTGSWTWDYTDIPVQLWAEAKPMLVERITKLYREGKIRCGSPAEGE